MIIEVKRCIAYPIGSENQNLKIGTHTVPDDSLNHWFVRALINNKDIVLLGDKIPEPKTLAYPDAVKTTVHTITIGAVKPLDSVGKEIPKPKADMTADQLKKVEEAEAPEKKVIRRRANV